MGAGDRGIEVGVGEYDVGAFPSQFEADAFEVRARGGLHDEPAGGVLAGEGDLVDIHMAAERGAGGGAEPGNHIDDAVRNAGFLGELGDPERRKGGLLGGLEHKGAAGGQGGSPFPRLHQQREVPWDDLADHADGFMPGVAEEVTIDRDRLAVDLVRPAGVVAVALDGEGEVRGKGVANRLAIVERLKGGEFILVLFDEVGQAVEDTAAFRRAHAPPRSRIEGPARGGHGKVDVGLVAFGNIADLFTSRRVDRLKGFSGGAGPPLSIDKQVLVGYGDRFCRKLGGHAVVASSRGEGKRNNKIVRTAWSRVKHPSALVAAHRGARARDRPCPAPAGKCARPRPS